MTKCSSFAPQIGDQGRRHWTPRSIERSPDDVVSAVEDSKGDERCQEGSETSLTAVPTLPRSRRRRQPASPAGAAQRPPR